MNIIKLNTIGETTPKGTSGGEGGLQIKSVDITENGSKAITPDAEYSGMSKVVVNTDVDILQGLNFAGVYDDEQAKEINKLYQDAIDYAKSEAELINKSNSPTFLSGRYNTNPNMIFFPNIDLSKFTSLQTTFNFAGLLYFDNLTTYNVTDFTNTFRYAPARFIRCNTDNATTLSGCFYYSSQANWIELTSVENVTTFANVFVNMLNLKTIKFTKWKQGDILLSTGEITSDSIHYIIQNAMDVADGATTRTLTLSATAKTNWMNSEYYEEDEITRITKGIEIA